MNDRLSESCVLVSRKLVDAMWVLERAATNIVLVTDAEGHLVGTLTDGDVRRALLKGERLDASLASYMQREFTALGPGVGRAEVIDLMQARGVSQIPVVDDRGKLVGLHLLRELIGGAERPNWAVIMAGGKGTRLRPITENLPKPMIKVAGRPILERLILHLVGFGIKRIYVSVNYLGQMIETHFGDGSAFGCRIDYLREEQEMGTGGSLALLPELPEHPVLVLNGDLVTQYNVHNLLAFHEQGGYAATIAVRRYFHLVPFGCLEVSDGQVRRLEEKPMLQQLINAGTYVLSPATLKRVPKSFFPITGLFEQCLRSGDRIGAWEIEEDWLDVGQKEQLKQAQEGIA